MTAPTRVALSLASVEMYLEARGLSDTYPDTVKVRGVGDATDVKQTGAGRAVILSRGAGPGLRSNWLIDQPIVTLRCIGPQGDYDAGEEFAGNVDRFMLADSNVTVGTVTALYVVRAGGGPAHIHTDQARRAHFSCSYVIPVASGL